MRELPASKNAADDNFFTEELRKIVSDECRIAIDPIERHIYSRDVARVPSFLEKLLFKTTPQLIVQPTKEADIIAIFMFASRHHVPIYPRGVSSSAFGGSVPTTDGMVLDLSSMREILEINIEQKTVRLQTGVRWADLAEFLRPHHLQPMTTPSSRFSTIGGWAATGGLGIESLKYGHFREAICGARIVLADGRLLQLVEGPELDDFIGSEGQLGVFSELTLRLREMPKHSRPLLFHFSDMSAALTYAESIAKSNACPSHISYYDANRLEEENIHFRDRTGLDQEIAGERDALLLHFNNAEDERLFHKTLATDSASANRHDTAASYLWSERYFPLKFQRLGPGLLAAEVILPHAALSAFAQRGRGLARRFGVTLAIEATASRAGAAAEAALEWVVIASFRCDHRRRTAYFLKLLLVQLLVNLGIKLGGRAYGFGIWNAPFFGKSTDDSMKKRLCNRKANLDSNGLLNPMKFFSLRPRNPLRVLFFSRIYRVGLWKATLFSPLIGMLTKLLSNNLKNTWPVPKPDADGRRLLQETALRCTYCGACVSTCPAYRLTRDERATGRGKLRLFEALTTSKDVSASDAASPFQCLHCRLCEEICQTGLPLVECYTALEGQLEKTFGRPKEEIKRFADTVYANRDWIEKTFGLELPPWSANGAAHPFQDVKRHPPGGGA